jgi:hypothetical protein
MNLVKNEYEDIIKEIVPSNLLNTYDLRNASDIK